MHKYITTSLIVFSLLTAFFQPSAVRSAVDLNGLILLQVDNNGEAWYVHPLNGQRYFLNRPADAFLIMKKFSLGATHKFINETEIFPSRLSGRILLDVEQNGEAYYIYPKNLHKYYLGRPADAFRIMSELGLGISNKDLNLIPVGAANSPIAILNQTEKILLDVPFTPQAPFGEWSDQRQQDGCEESSSLMAIKWAKNETLTRDDALSSILDASDHSLGAYGEYRDISAQDTVDWIIKDYFSYPDAILKKDITIPDIIDELKNGNLVLTPMDGQLLRNPYFTPPGPPRHMLVIRGYDPSTNRFITNDPGTRHGEGYEYGADILYKAIRDYPTGYHEPIDKIEKNMIIIWK